MNIHKVNRRDRKLNRRKNGHQVDGRSVFLIQEIQRKRSLEIRKGRCLKEKFLKDVNSDTNQYKNIMEINYNEKKSERSKTKRQKR